MATLLKSEGGATASILSELVEKASGVFLWVVLACRSLLQGLAAFDYLNDLQIRVRELPRELEDLFRHMLGRIERRYQGQAAKLLRLCYQSKAVKGTEPIQALGLALLDERGIDVTRSLDLHDVHSKSNPSLPVMEGRLRSRCCGLLEVKLLSYFADFGEFIDPQNRTCDGQDDGDDNRGLSLNSTVEFIHRSVFDFLRTPGVWDLDCLQVRDGLFEPNVILACLSLHMAHVSYREEPDQARGYIKDIFLYDRQGDNASSSPMMALVLLRLEDMVRSLLPSPGFSTAENYPPWMEVLGTPCVNLLLAVEAGMVNFVRSYAELNGLDPVADSHSTPLLYHALFQPFLRPLDAHHFRPLLAMVEYVLSLQPRPNVGFHNPSGFLAFRNVD